MIRIGTIWDRTTEVIAGRANILAAIALLLLVVPAVAQAAADAVAVDNPGLRLVSGLITLVELVCVLWGSLALTAVASDPAIDRAQAIGAGARRIGATIGVLAVAILVGLLASLPGILLLIASGFDVERARAGLDQVNLDAGKMLLATLYFVALLIVGLWVSARLVPLFAVVLNERRGLGAFARSFALTRGSTLRLIGVLILYVVVVMVVRLAATSIFGLIFRLILGPDSVAAVTFVAALVSAIVTAVFSVIQNVFSAQFYLAACERHAAA